MLENVKMKKAYQDIISDTLGAQPIMIDSDLVSAQRRKRFYRMNIKNVGQPEYKGIMLKDIVHEQANMNYALKENWLKWSVNKGDYLLDKQFISLNADKAITMVEMQYANWGDNFFFEWLFKYIVPFSTILCLLQQEIKAGEIGYMCNDSQGNRVYVVHNKLITLCRNAGGLGVKTGYLFGCLYMEIGEKVNLLQEMT